MLTEIEFLMMETATGYKGLIILVELIGQLMEYKYEWMGER
jgi:hypothetical protein